VRVTNVHERAFDAGPERPQRDACAAAAAAQFSSRQQQNER
jgi:hypothetical protein